MTPPTDTYLLLRAFVDELVRCGMRAACTSPGSRSAPLALSLARDPRLRCFSHVDERCAGFFALGAAKASGLPVAVTCTSGTAVAELAPAAIEAREARVPLLLLSADRPAELRENGAGQAIDQLKIFGDAAKWFFEVELAGAGERQLRWVRTLACRAYATTLEGAPGAVHLNFPLREPLVGDFQLPRDRTARAGDLPYVLRTAPPRAAGAAAVREEPALGELRALVGSASRGVLICGRHERAAPLGIAAGAFAEAFGWPLLADPLSGARRGQAAIAHYDALLRDARLAAELAPQVVIRVGDLPVSKPLRTWLAALDPDVRQVALDPEGAWQDPDSVLSDCLALEPASTLLALAPLAEQGDGQARGSAASEGDWLERWRSADQRAAEAIAAALGHEQLSEPLVARELGVLLPERATLFVASSMPVRDIETFWPARADPPRVLCNRGANGIDGTVSAAFGVAAASPGEPVVLLIGDVALAHDIGGLLAARRLSLKLTIVLIDNGGGGIFDFLAVSGAPLALDPDPNTPRQDLYTAHVATPTGLDFADAARLYGLSHERPTDLPAFRSALERALAGEAASIIEVRTRREENVALHRRVWREVAGTVTR
ncbi:MAG TPA: 2-succinyl-5-enolpyruvyl-6-hydroxy-3-cyclohexene-1-carboxylic-acid synthase [Solirubrobacteraceae bacterium]|jgi:2-succinyl-5-enolpyruvyl-6-hydroxy-3-cyclohexene-1-carboxylate synthase